MHWINIKDTWLDFERVKHFKFSQSQGKTRIYFCIRGGGDIYLDFYDDEDAEEVREFLETLIEKEYYNAKFMKKEPKKEVPPEKKKRILE